MDRREELLEEEQAAWEAFSAAVAAVPDDRLDDRSVVPGWSTKDLIWHNLGWATFAADQLEAMAGAPFVDPFAGHDDAYWDGRGEEMIEAGRALSFEEVMAAVETTRERVRRAWSSLEEIDDDRARFFAEETSVHYEEHAAEIRRFLAEPDVR